MSRLHFFYLSSLGTLTYMVINIGYTVFLNCNLSYYGMSRYDTFYCMYAVVMLNFVFKLKQMCVCVCVLVIGWCMSIVKLDMVFSLYEKLVKN